MKKFLLALLLCVSFFVVSCDKNDEPAITAPQYRLIFLHSEDTMEIYSYYKNSLIKEWDYVETSTDETIAKAQYTYLEDGSMISISSEENKALDKWVFNENLYLNSDGTAKTAKGTVIIYNSNGSVIMQKNYTADFQYNNLKQLTRIDIAEKRFDDYGQVEEKPLEWYILIKWDNQNMTECTNLYSSGRIFDEKKYTYYDGVSVTYSPIIQYPILRTYYTPLRYQGVLGRQSADLVKSIRWMDNVTVNYSYDITTFPSHSIVYDYTETWSNKEIKYTVGWDNKKPD